MPSVSNKNDLSCSPSSDHDDHSTNRPANDELSIESLSSVITAAVQISSASSSRRRRPFSSLSMGNASIIGTPQNRTNNNNHHQRRSLLLFGRKEELSSRSKRTRSASLSRQRRFSWLVDHQQKAKELDGFEELVDCGIRVKEIKTTLKTMVIPHEVENPMPQVKIQRPGFARINYWLGYFIK